MHLHFLFPLQGQMICTPSLSAPTIFSIIGMYFAYFGGILYSPF